MRRKLGQNVDQVHDARCDRQFPAIAGPDVVQAGLSVNFFRHSGDTVHAADNALGGGEVFPDGIDRREILVDAGGGILRSLEAIPKFIEAVPVVETFQELA